MSASKMVEELARSFETTASVKSVFGEPIHAEGKTIVPIAKIAYGFGAGGGHGLADHQSGSKERPEGGGGGGGLRAFPAGVLEITQTGIRFVPFADFRWLAGAFAVGLLAGRFLLRSRRSPH